VIANVSAIARLVSIEAQIARLEAERDRAFDAWIKTDLMSAAAAFAIARLHELDVQLNALEAQRHRLRAEARGERHLRIVR
jgi:uncharacterized membrane protein YidH (DUF202 family)